MILPYVLIGWQNKHLLNQVKKDAYQMPSLPNDILSGRSLSSEEKLYLVALENNGNGVSIVETYKEPEAALKEKLMAQFSKILTSLQDTSVVPSFACLGRPRITALSKVKITDQTFDYGWVELWDMTVTFQNASVSVLMDAEVPFFYSFYASTTFVESGDTDFSAYLESLGAVKEDDVSMEDYSETHYEVGLKSYQVVYVVESGSDFFKYYPVEVTRVK